MGAILSLWHNVRSVSNLSLTLTSTKQAGTLKGNGITDFYFCPSRVFFGQYSMTCPLKMLRLSRGKSNFLATAENQLFSFQNNLFLV